MKRFQSEIDTSLVVLLSAIGLGTFFLLLSEANAATTEAFWFSLTVLLLADGLVLWIFLSTYYDIDGNTLTIHSGPLSWNIPISEIDDVQPSRFLISGPALSLNRLEICYQQGKKLRISPKHQAEFLNALGR